MIVLGVMTGTSCDGLDAVCVEFTKSEERFPKWKILWSESLSYPKNLRARVLKLQLPKRKISLKDFLELDRDLGLWYGDSLRKMMERNSPHPHAIANHGQTVAHFPDSETTLQLGDPTRIANATGLSVISHFREGDMAAGGQGAPLLPLFHQILASQLPEAGQGIAIHNLGGISNLTYIHPNGEVTAFDTGPSNIWIDEAVAFVSRGRKKFDRDGAIARKGVPDSTAVEKLLKLPYFKKSPPKSTGRDDFPFSLLRSKTRVRGENLVATATLATVETVSEAYQNFILKKGYPLAAVYCAGGGGKNGFMMELLSKRLEPVKVTRLAEAGISGLSEQILEPLGFAMFGYLSLKGQSLGGSWTGAQNFGSPGWITPGGNWRELLDLR